MFQQIAELLELGQIIHRGLTLSDFLQKGIHLDSSGTARDAFAAGFIHAEFHEELARRRPCGMVLIHDDEPAGAHDRA